MEETYTTQLSALASTCRVANVHDTVFNSECVYTFHSPYTTSRGIVVDLKTWVGTIDELAFQKEWQAVDSSAKSSVEEEYGIFVRIVKQRVVKKNVDDDGPSAKVTKLGVGIEGGFAGDDSNYETHSTYSIAILKKCIDGTVQSVIEFPHDPQNWTPCNSTTEKDDVNHLGTTLPDIVRRSADSIILHTGAATQIDLTAWELDQEMKPISRYAESLPFVDNGVMISPNPKDWKCQKSGDTENLWLNLSDGYIGGGRKHWDGSGGSNGALDHYNDTGGIYPLVVKLGTISQEIEAADCYSYAPEEDGPVQVPNLAMLLARRGIHVASMQKCVKTTAELEVELNATYAFDAITESGSNLVSVSGPGLQGLQNLGNSCYMNSVVQMLFGGSIPELADRYGYDPSSSQNNITSHRLLKVSPRNAAYDIICQTTKLCCALTSGVFACPLSNNASSTDSSSSLTSDPKYRLAPRMFKNLIGKDHVDFRTGQQQDAAQYLQFLLEKIDRAELGWKAKITSDSTDIDLSPKSSSLFSFKTSSRLLCSVDNRIKYTNSAPETILGLRIPMEAIEHGSSPVSEPDEKRMRAALQDDQVSNEQKSAVPTVSFQACINAWSSPHLISDVRWEHLGNIVAPATQTVRFLNFPRYLIIRMQRYELDLDWTPKKLEVNIDIDEDIDLNHLRFLDENDGVGIIPDVITGKSSPVSPAPSAIDEVALSQLLDMGFSLNGCKRALKSVGGSDTEAAMNWIFEHNSDPDFDEPLHDESSVNSAESSIDENMVSSLMESCGCFTKEQVRAALLACNKIPDRAADWLFSHMDDIDGAISMLNVSMQSAKSHKPTPVDLFVDDGDGKYSLIGMISHIGKNTSSGHYVAHLKKDGKWIIFNDEKVALSETPPLQHAYLYLFQRKNNRTDKTITK